MAEDLTNVTVIKWLESLSPRVLRKRGEVRLVHRLSNAVLRAQRPRLCDIARGMCYFSHGAVRGGPSDPLRLLQQIERERERRSIFLLTTCAPPARACQPRASFLVSLRRSVASDRENQHP